MVVIEEEAAVDMVVVDTAVETEAAVVEIEVAIEGNLDLFYLKYKLKKKQWS